MSTIDRKLRVFLCHASQDKPIVRELYQRLLAEGWIDPWLDEEKLLPGQDWDMEIEKAVEVTDAVVVCLSNDSVTKEGYVQREIRKVLDVSDEKPEGTIFVIPVRLENIQIPRRLKIWQCVDFFPNDVQVKNYIKVINALGKRYDEIVGKQNSTKALYMKAGGKRKVAKINETDIFENVSILMPKQTKKRRKD